MAAKEPRVNLLFPSQTRNFSLGLAAKAGGFALGGGDEEDAMVDCVVSVEEGLRIRVGGMRIEPGVLRTTRDFSQDQRCVQRPSNLRGNLLSG